MSSNFLQNINTSTQASSMSGYPTLKLIELLGHSLACALILCFITYILNSQSLAKSHENYKKKKIKLVLGISNLLYLCTGLTGVMILVNNNLARAFSIGAAIALVRFKIKLGQKSADSNILFAIACGIACGLNELNMSWLLVALYCIISLPLAYFTKMDHATDNL